MVAGILGKVNRIEVNPKSFLKSAIAFLGRSVARLAVATYFVDQKRLRRRS